MWPLFASETGPIDINSVVDKFCRFKNLFRNISGRDTDTQEVGNRNISTLQEELFAVTEAAAQFSTRFEGFDRNAY